MYVLPGGWLKEGPVGHHQATWNSACRVNQPSISEGCCFRLTAKGGCLPWSVPLVVPKILTITLNLIVARNKPQALDRSSGEESPEGCSRCEACNNEGGYSSSRGSTFYIISSTSRLGFGWALGFCGVDITSVGDTQRLLGPGPQCSAGSTFKCYAFL